MEMNRRTFLKGISGLALGIGIVDNTIKLSDKIPGLTTKSAYAASGGCRIVVFGSDSLRIDYAETLVEQGAPGISRLNFPICSLSGGMSVTQSGWASIWSGMPSYWNNAYANYVYGKMPRRMHIIKKLAKIYENEDLYITWVTGKGHNIKGNKSDSPHHQVYKLLVKDGHMGDYYGDEGRENSEVFDLAGQSLSEAIKHQHFIAFVHFGDPDHTGHKTHSYSAYMEKAYEVDGYISQLMDLLSSDTDVIYCSDHGFDFKENGDIKCGHKFSPQGMLATNFATFQYSVVDQMSIGRLVYTLAGGDPDFVSFTSLGGVGMRPAGKVQKGRMYGINLI